MNNEFTMNLFYEAIKISLMLALPALLSSLFSGLIISVFQAATQINEQTLSFIPKILSVLVSLIIFGPWMLVVIEDYTRSIFNSISVIN